MAEPRAEVIAHNQGVVVGPRWRDTGRTKPMEFYQVLKLRDGRIVDMQDVEDRREALEAHAR